MIAGKLLSVCPLVAAALLLVARSLFEQLGLPAPDVAQILAATKASRSAAYALLGPLLELLPTLARPRGRPPKPPSLPATAPSESAELTRAVLAYVMRHPGSVHQDHQRQQYSDGFRHCVLEQRALHATLNVEVVADAAAVPIGTLKDWLRAPLPTPQAPAPAPPAEPTFDFKHLATVLDAWSRWEGDFGDFCDHVRRDLHVPMGKALVGRILQAHGARTPERRHGRRSDEVASRGAFHTFFPGAQWVGDGMELPVLIDGKRFTFNVELDVDAHTGAFVGISVRDEEDAAAVVEAFKEGVLAAGAPSLSLLLDNRPSNHTDDVKAALGDTQKIRATLWRPQNKAHVEGAFGLFSRALPVLTLDTRGGALDLARSLVGLVARIWAGTMNHRPRADRGGRSRVELYGDKPSPEQVDDARRQLRTIAEQQERARRTLQERRRPEVLQLLDDHFARLGLLDPERHVRVAIAGFPLDAILAGVAIFDGKQRAATLPDGVDARYLLGIVRNVAAKAEGEHVARAMLALRLDARDRMLAPLCAARAAVCAGDDVTRVAADCVDRALRTKSPLEREFWLGALADTLVALPLDGRRDHFLAASRRIHATFAVSPRERGDAVRVLAERLVLVA